jgi:hypothetical protein
MRPWICMLGIAALSAASALPAAADNMTPRSPNVALNGTVQAPFPRHGFVRHQSTLGPFVLGSPFILPGGSFDGDAVPGVASGTPMAVPPRLRRSAVEERASVETTQEGIVIVRGPGSHHLSP